MINEIVYNLIHSVKGTAGLSEVDFFRTHSEDIKENPITGYKAVVGVSDIKTVRKYVGGLVKNNTPGEIRSFIMKIRLFCGDEISGSDLCDKAVLLVDNLCEIDSDGFVDNTSISNVKVDGETGNIYIDIEARISFNDCGAVV